MEIYHHDPLARISIPSSEKIESYKAAFAECHPLLNDCWATMDGLKLYLQAAGNSDIQVRCYNGWTHDHYVTSVFCFCPDGTIPFFLMSLDQCTTVRLQNLVKHMTNWRWYIVQQVGSVALTQYLGTLLTGITSTNHARMFLAC